MSRTLIHSFQPATFYSEWDVKSLKQALKTAKTVQVPKSAGFRHAQNGQANTNICQQPTTPKHASKRYARNTLCAELPSSMVTCTLNPVYRPCFLTISTYTPSKEKRFKKEFIIASISAKCLVSSERRWAWVSHVTMQSDFRCGLFAKSKLIKRIELGSCLQKEEKDAKSSRIKWAGRSILAKKSHAIRVVHGASATA